MRSAVPAALLALLLLPAIAPAQDPAVAPAPQSAPAQPPASPPPANAPPAPAPFTIRTTSRLVILDVVVLDKKGNIVPGLKREDFHVTESDQPQNILNFEATDAHAVPADAAIESTADLDRIAPRAPVNIILLDEFNTRFEDMAFARYSLKKWLQSQPDKLSTPTMLIAVDLQHFTVLRDYTQDKQQILTALDHHFAGYPWQAHQGAWVAERFNAAFTTLNRVAQAVIGHPGHKNMIWIGRGFPPVFLQNLPVDTDTRLNNAVQECVNSLRDARVTLYTVDPAGLQVDPGTYGSAAAFNDPFGGNYQFEKLAVATGGRTFHGRNDVDAQIATSIRDGNSFYTLTYRPDNNGVAPQKFRRIKIAFNNPDYTAVTRQGYYQQRGPGRVDAANPSRRLMSDLYSADTSTMVYDAVPLTIQPDVLDPDTFHIHVDAKALSWTYATDTEPRHAEITFVASSFDKKGKQLKSFGRVIKASAPPSVPPTGRLERGMDMKIKLDHEPKAVRARFVIRVSASGRIGTVDAPMNQPLPPAPASNATPTPPPPPTP